MAEEEEYNSYTVYLNGTDTVDIDADMVRVATMDSCRVLQFLIDNDGKEEEVGLFRLDSILGYTKDI